MHAILSFQFDDVLKSGWQEVNQGTRNLIQKNVSGDKKKSKSYFNFDSTLIFQLDCCGWLGPSDFAYNSEPIDDSCYENLGGNSGILARPSTENGFDSTKKMKQVIRNFFLIFKRP